MTTRSRRKQGKLQARRNAGRALYNLLMQGVITPTPARRIFVNLNTKEAY